MKKIMFNDKYGLTQAVLDGRKTMTRRIIKVPNRTIEGKEVCGFEVYKNHKGVPYDVWLTGPDDESLCQLLPTYKIGEEVAIAQAYKEFRYVVPVGADAQEYKRRFKECAESAGWNNKMFVKAAYMAKRIRITDIKIEKLQDISYGDCIKEGVIKNGSWRPYNFALAGFNEWFETPVQAFAALINKVNGKGTWESNPWAFAYTFELVKGGGE